MKTMKILILIVLSSTFYCAAQKTVQFRISQVYSDVDDMDGFGAGASDPQWNYRVNDNTFGATSGDNNTELSGTNCPYWRTLNDQFFSQIYDCDLPTSYTFIWSGFEDDGVGTDANTGNRTVNFTSASINPNQTVWTNAIVLQTATASGDACGGGSTVTWRIQLQYRVLGTSLCNDECISPYVLPTAEEFVCGPAQTSTSLSTHIYAREPADASEFSFSTAGITCTYDGASPEDVWVQTTIPENTGGVNIQFENHGECSGVLCQTNVTYAWYTSSDGTCAGLEYRGCGSVSCFIGCSDGEIQVDGNPGDNVWVRIWEEDDQGHHIEINQISPTAPADKCYTALPLSGTGCNYSATSPSSGLYAEPDLALWTALAHPGGACQDGDMDPLTNTVWSSNENMVWYTYTHAGGDFNLAIDNMSCTGGAATAQVGVFSNSGTPEDPTCDLAGETGYGCSVGVGQVQLSINSLPSGNYMVVVDGNAGAECDWVFTDFIGNPPLPVELFRFNASLIDANRVKLNWVTGSERDNDYFTIERSSDGEGWEELNYVQGAGNSVEMLSYEEWDNNALYGISYYRIKQTDFNGESTYSGVRSVNNKLLFDVVLYPNPAKNELTVAYNGDESISLSIVNGVGQTLQLPTQSFDGKTIIDVSMLANGVYYVLINREDTLQQEKFVVRK